MKFLKDKYPDTSTTMKQLYDYKYEVFKKEMDGQGVCGFFT